MDENKVIVEEPTPAVEEPVVEEPVTEPVVEEPVPATDEEPAAASENPEETPAPVDPEPEFKKDEENSEFGCQPKDEKEEDEEKKKYELLEEQFNALQDSFNTLQENFNTLQADYTALADEKTALQASHDELVEFKRQIDDAKKDQMIESFTMLSDEDKAEVNANKANYSLAEIEEKLSVICFRKGNFNSINNNKNNNNTEAPITTFNFNAVNGSTKPAWLSAVDNTKNNKY